MNNRYFFNKNTEIPQNKLKTLKKEINDLGMEIKKTYPDWYIKNFLMRYFVRVFLEKADKASIEDLKKLIKN